MKLAAIDPGVTSPAVATSWGVLTCVKPKRSWGTGAARLAWLSDEIGQLCEGADVVAIEDYAYGAARQGHSASIVQLAELGGVLKVAFWARCVPLVPVPLSKLKILATGTSVAKPSDVLAAAIRRLGYDGSSEDEATALWLLEFARRGYGRPSIKLPFSHTRGVTEGAGVVEWPVIESARSSASSQRPASP